MFFSIHTLSKVLGEYFSLLDLSENSKAFFYMQVVSNY